MFSKNWTKSSIFVYKTFVCHVFQNRKCIVNVSVYVILLLAISTANSGGVLKSYLIYREWNG